jgi:methylenetetrahydrofolate dehydrogenase (NADP+) / methenyltetrahydrofolate cyclohydrolase
MKEIIRNQIIDERNMLNVDEVLNRSRNIIEKVKQLKQIEDSTIIGVYISKDNEVETRGLVNYLLNLGKRIVVPRINNNKIRDNEMEFKEINSINELEKGNYDILEPKKECKTICDSLIETMIIPCVAIDMSGNRIGRGKGYYDQKLTNNSSIIKIALAYDFQIKNKIIADTHDIPIDIIVSESNIKYRDKNDNTMNRSKIINGKIIAEKIIKQTKEKIEKIGLINKLKLVAVLIGNDPASEMYVKMKGEKCNKIGINFELKSFNESASNEEIIDCIEKLNEDNSITGVMIQLPIPDNFDKDKIINSIDIKKDVDGLTIKNRHALKEGDEDLACCAPKAIMRLITEYNIKTDNKKIILLGRGFLIGYPLSLMLDNRKIKYKLCGRDTPNLKNEIKNAEILITSTGTPHMIGPDDIKEGVVVIDAGSAKLKNKIVGDVDYKKVKLKASYITPTYGGVGPMTIAILIENILTAYLKFNKEGITQNEEKDKIKYKFQKFNDLKKVNFDFHIHTNQTDGRSTAEEMVENAINMELHEIAFTEHVTKDSSWYNEFANNINKLKKENKDNLKIYLGIEAKVADFNGNIDATQEMIDKADIIVGVVHRYPKIIDNKIIGLISMDEISKMDTEEAADIEFMLIMGLLDNKNIDVLGHPFGVYSKYFKSTPEDKLKQVIKKAKLNDITIEINMKYILEKDIFFKLLREINPKISIGSDAHHKDELGKGLSEIKKYLNQNNTTKNREE